MFRSDVLFNVDGRENRNLGRIRGEMIDMFYVDIWRQAFIKYAFSHFHCSLLLFSYIEYFLTHTLLGQSRGIFTLCTS